MFRFFQIGRTAFTGVTANIFDGIALQPVKPVLVHELTGLDDHALIVVAADLKLGGLLQDGDATMLNSVKHFPAPSSRR